jgi:NADPH-dependent glutamate synthase beta subunit-like oxidoreductase
MPKRRIKMAEMSNAFTPEHRGEKNPNKKILKLGQRITDRIGHKVTSDDPEYWGLACICTDEMADVALKMKRRVPMTFEQLLKKTKLDATKLQKLLDEMAYVGVIEYNWENEKHEKQYVLPMFVPGSAEFSNMRKEQLDAHPELAMFFERMTYLPIAKIAPLVPQGGAGIGMHVIPVEKSISMENKSANIEHISYWLKKYEGKLSVGLCSCRYGRAKLGEGCGDNAEEWCIGVGDMATYCVETKKGRYATKEEVLEILERAEENGFVHQITNIDGENKIFAICNCNVNICNALRTSQLFNTPNFSRSAYTAKVDPKNCVACGRCVEVCPAGAVKLGQKLCTKNGMIEYPKHELPDHMPWGEDKWTENYRDVNRVECYPSGTAPCKATCPAHIAIQGYIKMASQGRYAEALALIKRENPFPAICGRVCNRACEDACTRGEIDKAVSIDAIKKFIADKDLDAKTRYIPKVVMPSNVGRWKEKIAIIGAGPAGLSCAFYLAEKGYYPTVFEKNARPGGMLMYGIPSYKLEKNVIDAEIDVLREMGVEINCGVEVGKDITIQQLRDEGFKGFYLAIGCQGGRLPGINGETAAGVTTAVKFLKEINDKKDVKLSGDVVVIGGGNVAIDASRCSTRVGNGKVTMVSLESRDIMPATKEEISEAEEENVTILNSYGPKEILQKDGHVYAIVLKKCTQVFDENKRFAPKYDDEDTITIKCNNVIFSIGQSIDYGNLLRGTKVEYGKGGRPIADPVTYQTAEKDIFVGGDVYTGPSFAINAIATGKQGAISLHRFVQKGTSLTIGRDLKQFIQLDKDNLIFGSYDKSIRQEAGMDKKIDYKHSFKDAHKTLTEEQIKIETGRCLGCGASIVDPNKCIGCGLCTTKCDFDAIHLFRDHPECSTMVVSEDKMKAILPYAAKRGIKIIFGKKTKEEKASNKKHKADQKALKQNKNNKKL